MELPSRYHPPCKIGVKIGVRGGIGRLHEAPPEELDTIDGYGYSRPNLQAVRQRRLTAVDPFNEKPRKRSHTVMMKRMTGAAMLAVMALAVYIALVAGAPSALAADAFKMGVIDPQEVLEKSKAGKRSLDALKEYARTRQKVLSTDEEELKGLEAKLKEQAPKASDQEKRAMEEQFRAKIQHYQKQAQEFNQDLQGKQKEMVDDYMKRIAVATKAVAERNGYSLVVDKGSEQTLRIVIYNKDTIDVTDQVIKEFDKLNPVK